jgi:hypothetical protein
VSVQEIASRIAAEPAQVAALLAEEAALGRVRRTDAGRWALVAGTVEARRSL